MNPGNAVFFTHGRHRGTSERTGEAREQLLQAVGVRFLFCSVLLLPSILGDSDGKLRTAKLSVV